MSGQDGRTQDDGVKRVLAVFAHPDDIDFGAAGTVAAWTDAGIEVAYVLVTRGDAGGFDDTPRAEMPKIREAEQKAAAAAVGVHEVHFLDGYPDGAVYVTHQLRRDITRQIRRFRPDRVLTNSPVRSWSMLGGPSHPDHQAVGEATTYAVYPDARNPFAHPELLAEEGLAAWTVPEVWYSGVPEPDHFVDITDTFDRKIAALRSHASQLPDPDAIVGGLRERFGAQAERAGMPAGRIAESFTIAR
ncbi:GlcNAc-PI de-N-acetylase [Actinocatenispora thailandica]|uniref:GlcNAc-PI de-N-acetylase n=1 Tax=Actinocatenispora thailandica TaxID=227318 RepID=A0A7R7DTW9_9ACTN|nr:PIG-L deacetylase family protein [Actinocatenispora thailandica]BCJ37753.1 GlcNAc-PI de-N-acetylase [Actinocatenispora thailandica]